MWKKPWNAGMGRPKSALGSEYRGINYLNCVLTIMVKEYKSPLFLTYKQAQSIGGQVRKGEKGIPILFYGRTEKENKDESYCFAKFYTVFNTDQIDGIDSVKALIKPAIKNDIPLIDRCEAVAKGFSCAPEVKHGGNQACYIPIRDEIRMPEISTFNSSEEYYSTLFHEFVHSTGHEKRLKRDTLVHAAAFGSPVYNKEELVAELGSAFLCAETGISPRVLDNQAAYIKGFLSMLKKSPKDLVSAASQAQKATDLILGKVQNENTN